MVVLCSLSRMGVLESLVYTTNKLFTVVTLVINRLYTAETPHRSDITLQWVMASHSEVEGKWIPAVPVPTPQTGSAASPQHQFRRLYSKWQVPADRNDNKACTWLVIRGPGQILSTAPPAGLFAVLQDPGAGQALSITVMEKVEFGKDCVLNLLM